MAIIKTKLVQGYGVTVSTSGDIGLSSVGGQLQVPAAPPSAASQSFYVYNEEADMLAATDTWQDGDVVAISQTYTMYRHFSAILENRGLVPLEPFGSGNGVVNSVTRLDGIEPGQDYTEAGWTLEAAGPTFTYYSGRATRVQFGSGQYMSLRSSVNLTSSDTAVLMIVEDFLPDQTSNDQGVLIPLVYSYIDAGNYGLPYFRLDGASTIGYGLYGTSLLVRTAATLAVQTYTTNVHEGSEGTWTTYHPRYHRGTFYAASNGANGGLVSSTGIAAKNTGGYTAAGDPTTLPAAIFRVGTDATNVSTFDLTFGRVGVYRLEVV